MGYNCACGSTIMLQTRNISEKIVNMMCAKCYLEKKPSAFRIEYEFPMLRAIYHARVLAETKEEAVSLLRGSVENKINIRKIEEL